MDNTKAAALLRKIAICCIVLLVGFRVLVLQTAIDKDGLLPRGSIALPATVLLCAAVFAALWILSSKLNRLPGREALFSVQGAWLPLKLIAAGLLLAGSVMSLLELQQLSFRSAETLIPAVGAVSGMLMGWTSLCEPRGKGFFWIRLIPSLFTGAALVMRFRSWSHNPMVIYIVPVLFSWACCMVEMMLLSGFSLNVGHRRSAVLFGLGAGIFACMAVPDYFLTKQIPLPDAFLARMTLPDLLTILGLSLWCFVAALELMRRRAQKN